MNSTPNSREQKHPQEKKDREIINSLLKEDPNDDNLLEIARLRIRYLNFPGAREIQRDIEFLLKKWGLSEVELYEKTRKIYTNLKIERSRAEGEEEQDWS
jgi:hypothetical protein